MYSIRHSIECSLSEQAGKDGNDEADVGEGSGVEQELRMLNEELRNIELECQSIMQAHQVRKTHHRDFSDSLSSPGWSPKESHKRHGRLADIHEYPERLDGEKIREKDSSSAYNTAESARSTPLGAERSPDHSLQRQISITNQKNLRLASSTSSSPIPIPKSQCTPSRSRPSDPSPVISSSPDQSNPSRSESDPALPADDERCDKKGRSRESRRGLPFASSYLTSPDQSQGGSTQLQVGRICRPKSECMFVEASHSIVHYLCCRVTCSCCNSTPPWSIPKASLACSVCAGIKCNGAGASGNLVSSGRSKSVLMARATWPVGPLATGS